MRRRLYPRGRLPQSRRNNRESQTQFHKAADDEKNLCAVACGGLAARSCGPSKDRRYAGRLGKGAGDAGAGRFLSSIRVEMQSGKRLKGKLIGTTDEALRIERKKAETAVAREDIRAVRLVPRKAPRTKNRTLAIAGAPPPASEGDLRPLRPTASSTAVPATQSRTMRSFSARGRRFSSRCTGSACAPTAAPCCSN